MSAAESELTVIYFLFAEGTEFIKIGFTSRDDVSHRLAANQTGSPHRLVLVSYGPGSRADDLQLRRLFRNRHVRGDWFRIDELLVKLATDMDRWTVRAEGSVLAICVYHKPTRDDWERWDKEEPGKRESLLKILELQGFAK